MRHIRLVSTTNLERSGSIKMSVRNKILDVVCTIYNFIPKFLLKSLRLHHASGHLFEIYILPLKKTILLRCLGNGVLHLDTYIFTILNKIRIDTLTTIIRLEYLDISSRLVLNQGFKNLEEVKKFILVLEEVNPIVSGKFIYEGKDILGLTHGHMMKRTNNVTVNKFKGCIGLLMIDSLT